MGHGETNNCYLQRGCSHIIEELFGCTSGGCVSEPWCGRISANKKSGNYYLHLSVFIIINNSLHLYTTFLGSQSTLHRRGNLINHHQCAASTWMVWQQLYCARTPTTQQLTGGEETEWWSQLAYIQYGDD